MDFAALASAAAFICGHAALYVALEGLSALQQHRGLPFAAWDPGLGVLFAAMIRRPRLGAAALFLAAPVTEFAWLPGPSDPLRALGTALIIASVYLSSALILTRWTAFNPALPRWQDVWRLVLAGLGGAILAGLFLSILYVVNNNLDVAGALQASHAHVIADTLGIAIVATLILRLTPQTTKEMPATGRRFIPDMVVFAAIAALYYHLASGTTPAESHRFFYLLFVPSVFSAVRHGLSGAAVALTATQISLVILLEPLTFDADNFAAHQTMMLVLTGTALLVGAIVSERVQIARDADTARNRLAAMEQASMRAARFNLINGMASTLAHELSQPLTAARARARLVEVINERGDPAAVREQITSLITQIDAASSILHRMREFIGRRETRRETTPWSIITAKSGELLALRAREKNVRLVFADDGRLSLNLHCDAIQIEQVLVNLIGNAIDAITSPDGEVTISIRRVEGAQQAEISVRDNGQGIAPELQASIFEPLATTRRDGLGLGLAICALIVESHSGALWLETSKPGSTEFRFTLPLAKGDATS